MALVSLLLGLPQKGTRIARNLTKAGITASIFLDATVKEGFSAPSELTQHPIEDGSDIADHIIIRPQKLTIEGVISETPFSVSGQIAGIASTVASQIGQGVAGSIGGAIGAGVAAKTLAGVLQPKSVTGSTVVDEEAQFREENGLPGENVRLRDAVTEFMNIRDGKIPLTIITGLRQYTDFVLIGFDVTRDQTTGQSLRVSLEFQQLLFATSRVEKVPVPKNKNALNVS